MEIAICENLKEIEEKRVKFVREIRHKKNNSTLRAINTIRKLEKLPISEIKQKNIEFISKY